MARTPHSSSNTLSSSAGRSKTSWVVIHQTSAEQERQVNLLSNVVEYSMQAMMEVVPAGGYEPSDPDAGRYL